MKESDLYPMVRDWLIERGYQIHVEIFSADIVAVKDGKLTAVELKINAAWPLFHQLVTRSAWADFAIGVMPYRPKCISIFRTGGFGFLIVNGDRVREVARPRQQPWGWYKKHDYRVKKLTGRAPAMAHEVAGLPSCPALKQQRLARTS